MGFLFGYIKTYSYLCSVILNKLIMALELNINGYFDLVVCSVGTEVPVDRETELGVLDNLQQGEYLLNMRDRTIFDINDLSIPIYSVVIEATESSEYEFEELED